MESLSPRLRAIADLVENCNVLADIGTDHGLVPLELLKKGIARSAIVSDISPMSLKKAEVLLKSAGFSDKVSFRCGNGFKVLAKGEASHIIIAGMGGVLISEILEDSQDIARTSELILNPMNASDKLRRYLYKSGFKVLKEELAIEGERYYEIISTIYTGHILHPTWKEINVGSFDRDEKFKAFLQKKISDRTDILSKIEGSGERTEERRSEIREEIKRLEDILNEA